jgi:hypothetical protein
LVGWWRVGHPETTLMVRQDIIRWNEILQTFENDLFKNFANWGQLANGAIVGRVWVVLTRFRNRCHGKFLRRIFGTPSKPGALPFLSFLIIFLTYLRDVKGEGAYFDKETSFFRKETNEKWFVDRCIKW